MTLNPSEVFFHKGSKQLMWWAGSPSQNSIKDYDTVKNTVFSGVLKVISVSDDITVEIIQGPSDLIGKVTSQISSNEFNKALREGTLGYDSRGLYLTGTWVFAKRGQYVRLIQYKA